MSQRYKKILKWSGWKVFGIDAVIKIMEHRPYFQRVSIRVKLRGLKLTPSSGKFFTSNPDKNNCTHSDKNQKDLPFDGVRRDKLHIAWCGLKGI